MNDNQVKIFVYITVVFGACFWLALYSFQSFGVFSVDSLKALFSGISLTLMFWTLYFKAGWRWPYLRKIMFKPDLNGTWIGRFSSDWKDTDGNAREPAKFVLVVRQTWFSLSIQAFTELQTTSSKVEKFIYDKNIGLKLLAYMFNEEDKDFENSIRKGAAQLSLSEFADRKRLSGHFWTYAGTKGTLEVKLMDSKMVVDDFSTAIQHWAVNEDWLI